MKEPTIGVEKKSLPLSGKSFVFTGELKAFSRYEAENKIKELGAKTNSTVTKKTDYVIVGENPGSKYTKAKKLNIKTINEQEFLKILKS